MNKDAQAEPKKAVAKSVKRDRAKRPAQLTLAAMLLLSTSAGFAGGWIGSEARGDHSGRTVQEQREVVSSESDLYNAIVGEVGPSVVSVNVTSQGVSNSFFSFGELFEVESAGTGVIISEDGVVVTNRHVVPRDSSTVSVTLSDGTQLDNVEVIGRTQESDPLDIAFLKINDSKGKDLVPAKLGDSSTVEVGDKVLAIGNALGQFQNTVTAGIISGYGRTVVAADDAGAETLQNLFQTDTAINQGNSGGPLVNLNGEVIGINTAVAGNAENIGFAIPVNDIQGLIKSVLEEGQLLRPYLGVRYISLTDDYAYLYNLDVKRGAYLAPSGNSGQPTILPGSPAEKAGLREKDIITKVNDTVIDEDNSLTSVLGRFSVGERVTLTIIRDGQEQKVEATLEAAPES